MTDEAPATPSPETPPYRARCIACRYERLGLALDATCPECGCPGPTSAAFVAFGSLPDRVHQRVVRAIDRCLAGTTTWVIVLFGAFIVTFRNPRWFDDRPAALAIILCMAGVALIWTQFGWWSFGAPSAEGDAPAWPTALWLRIQTVIILATITVIASTSVGAAIVAQYGTTLAPRLLRTLFGIGMLALPFVGATRLLTVLVRTRRFAERLAAPDLAFNARLLLIVEFIAMVLLVVTMLIAVTNAPGSEDVVQMVLMGGIALILLLEAILLIQLRQVLRARMTARHAASSPCPERPSRSPRTIRPDDDADRSTDAFRP